MDKLLQSDAERAEEKESEGQQSMMMGKKEAAEITQEREHYPHHVDACLYLRETYSANFLLCCLSPMQNPRC